MRSSTAAQSRQLNPEAFLKSIPGVDQIHPLIRRYLAENQSALAEIDLAQWKRASGVVEKLRPDHPALQGSLTAFLKAHAAGVIALQKKTIAACAAFRHEEGMHRAVARLLEARPEIFVLLSPYGWREISILCKNYPCTHPSIRRQLEDNLAKRLPASLVSELSRLARAEVFSLAD